MLQNVYNPFVSTTLVHIVDCNKRIEYKLLFIDRHFLTDVTEKRNLMSWPIHTVHIFTRARAGRVSGVFRSQVRGRVEVTTQCATGGLAP